MGTAIKKFLSLRLKLCVISARLTKLLLTHAASESGLRLIPAAPAPNRTVTNLALALFRFIGIFC
jgi:hypothetical protein